MVLRHADTRRSRRMDLRAAHDLAPVGGPGGAGELPGVEGFPSGRPPLSRLSLRPAPSPRSAADGIRWGRATRLAWVSGSALLMAAPCGVLFASGVLGVRRAVPSDAEHGGGHEDATGDHHDERAATRAAGPVPDRSGTASVNPAASSAAVAHRRRRWCRGRSRRRGRRNRRHQRARPESRDAAHAWIAVNRGGKLTEQTRMDDEAMRKLGGYALPGIERAGGSRTLRSAPLQRRRRG